MHLHATCTDLFTRGTRELAAFLCAVEEAHGPEQAALVAEDWLTEFESFDPEAEFAHQDWRRVTMGAAVRLAARIAPRPADASNPSSV